MIAIFLSGSGSNARKILDHFKSRSLSKNPEAPAVAVSVLVSNKPELGGRQIAEDYGLPLISLNKSMLYDESLFLNLMAEYKVSFIVLAGFLLLIPAYLVEKYDHRIVNIHPALLPKFGGKGMYGKYVHEAVHAAREVESGITIHYCDAHYDEGSIIFQAKTALDPTDTAADIARKVLALEHAYYPKIIEKLITQG
jgi:phosphoribosylglycinamide formyltransferase-1